MANYLTVSKDTARLKYPDTETTLTINVFSADVLATPAAITGKWRIGPEGADTSMTLTPGATGIYTATLNPDESGFIHYRIKTTTPTVSIEGTYQVEPTHFNDVSTKDYQ